MTSRERVRRALRHEATDRLPIDLGATPVTGIAASTVDRLRRALRLREKTVRVHKPLQLLGEVDEDVLEALGVDTVGVWGRGTIFGYPNDGPWRAWALQDGTPVEVPAGFQTTVEEGTGDVLIYPQGNRSASPSGRLPKGGYYFDAIVRQGEIDEDKLDPRDWDEQLTVLTDKDLSHFDRESKRLYEGSDRSLVGVFGWGGLGDVAFVPGQMLLEPKGVRDPQLWYEVLLTHEDYVRSIFEKQTEVCLKNLELYRQAVGGRVDTLMVSGTDFGTQRGLFVSLELFRRLWKPLFTKINAWIHANTGWKVFYHSCGAVRQLIPDLIECGVDVLNPVQCSAEGMEPGALKRDFGEKLVFWGGGVDTQRVLPFGTPAEVRAQVAERCRLLAGDGPRGGFVFNTIHNIQQGTPPENLIAMYDAVRAWRG